MKCLYCGKEIMDGSKVCTSCGKKRVFRRHMKKMILSGVAVICMVSSMAAPVARAFTPSFRSDNTKKSQEYQKLVQEKLEKEHISEYAIEDYLGFYYEDILPEEVDQREQHGDPVNPKCVSLYFNEEGLLECYTGLKAGTLGTSLYYPYQSYEMEGNELICHYDYVDSPYGIREDMSAGVHFYIMNEDGTLTEDTHILYKVNKQKDESKQIISEDTSPAQALEEFFFDYKWHSDVEIQDDPMHELVDIDQDSVPELVIRTGIDMDVSYYVYLFDQDDRVIQYAGSFENGFGSAPSLCYSPSFKALSTYGRTSDSHRDYFYQLKNKRISQYPFMSGWYDIKDYDNFRHFFIENTVTGENVEVSSANWNDTEGLKEAEEKYKVYTSDLLYISFDGNVSADEDMDIYSFSSDTNQQ